MGTPVSESRTLCNIQVPPSDLVDNLGKLLESEEGADVTFKVEDKVFHAHKIVLAMRSPVFKVELYGPMRDKNQPSITVEDMQPAVFKALLHFIYKDSLPVMDNLDEDENTEMVKHLLVAADRYALERMKLMCENILCKKLDAGSVAAVLALADQHHCSKLKDACIQFINSSTKMDDLVASHGYAHLKRACPTVFADIWEWSAKFH
jgi:speckle-type POZ protein